MNVYYCASGVLTDGCTRYQIDAMVAAESQEQADAMFIKFASEEGEWRSRASEIELVAEAMEYCDPLIEPGVLPPLHSFTIGFLAGRDYMRIKAMRQGGGK